MIMIIIASIFLSAVLGDSIVEKIPAPAKQHRWSDDNYVNLHPWVALIADGYYHKCSGSILTNSIILTSAQCIINRKNGLRVWVGGTIGQEGSSSHEVINSRSHNYYANFNGIPDNDLALIKVSPPFTFNYKIREFLLPIKHVDSVAVKTVANISGWTMTQNQTDVNQHVYYKSSASLEIIDEVKCAKEMHNAGMSPNGQFCAIVHGRGICRGDSGGPVVKNNVQVGIIPWTHDCDGPHHQRLFWNIGPYLGGS